MTVQEQVPLADYTTLGVGGPARWLVEAEDESELLAAVRYARARKAPFFLLGGGSNVLVADEGFAGVVINYTGTGRIEVKRTKKSASLSVDAGVEWDSLVLLAVKKNLAGIECLAGIPGSVGGTPVQNVGAYGQEVSSTITRVRAVDLKTLKFVELTAAKCGFAYRRSMFNTTRRGRYAITRVNYSLKADGAAYVEYRDLKQRFAGKAKPTLAEVASAVRTIRASKGMLISADDPDSHSAGSFFKNPLAPASAIAKLAAIKGCKKEEVPQFPSSEKGKAKLVKLSAAWLIELAGFHKGHTLGHAALSTKHVLAIVNRGGATAAEIIALRDAVVEAVRTRTGIALEQEPVLVGFGGAKA